MAVIALGIREASQPSETREPTTGKLTASEQRGKLAGAPPALAALHRQANALLPGGRAALHARVQALRGHPVVINVWAAWCGPCRDELPLFQGAAVDWGKRVAFVGVDLRDSRAGAARLLHEIPVSYPSFEDPDGKIAAQYRLRGTPSTIFYAASGRVTFVRPGAYRTRGDLDADIRRHALRRRS